MPHVTCDKQKNGIVLKTDYWTVEHDLKGGGCWSGVRFGKGSRKNLLTSPVGSRLRFFRDPGGEMYGVYDSFEERLEKRPKVTIRKNAKGEPVVVTEGRYTDASGRKLPVRFRRTCEYRDWGLVASELEVICERRVPGVMELSAAAFTLRPGMTDFLVREHPAVSADASLLGHGDWLKIESKQIAWRQRYAPIHLCIFEKDVEGIELYASSDLSAWDTQITPDPGQGLYFVAADAKRETTVELNPFCRAFRRMPVTLNKKTYRFRMYWGVPFVRERGTTGAKYFHASVNSDWASDEELERLANAGVKLVRFHCDYRDDAPFWRDGKYPPFDKTGMNELARMIDTCHRLGMKIVPYVSLKEFHPESPGYKRNRKAWTQKPFPSSDGIHTHVRKGEFGQVMCMESGWLAFRKRACDIMLDDLPWDGLYFDWCSPHGCMHPGHMPGKYHTDTDGFFDFLFYARERVGPEGILLLHLSGLPYLVAENMMDLAIIYEDVQGVIPLPGEYPVQCDFFPVNQRCLILSPSDATNQRKVVMGGLLQGHPPLTQMPPRFGRSFPEVVLKEMELFGCEDLSRYRFRRSSDRPVATGRETVHASLHHRRGCALVYLGNFCDKAARGTFRFDPSCLGKAAARRKVTVSRMVPVGRTRTVGRQSAASLKKKGVNYALKPWGSALYKIEATRANT